MILLRAFLAIEVPTEIKKKIASQTAELRQKAGRSVRWVTDENIHITLKFLGEISSTSIEALSPMLKSEAGKHPPFEVTVAGLGAFPNLRRPRIIWVGLNAPTALSELQQALEAAVTPFGHLPDKRPFSPHLTIGRIREGLSDPEMLALQPTLENMKVCSPGNFTVESIHLMQSKLKPSGPVYIRLSTVRLGG